MRGDNFDFAKLGGAPIRQSRFPIEISNITRWLEDLLCPGVRPHTYNSSNLPGNNNAW